MPRKAVKSDPDKFKIKVEQDEEVIKKTRRKAAIPTFKSRSVNPLTQFMIDNEDSGKTRQELLEEFRADCIHQFQEVANLHTNGTRISIQTCKVCGISVKGSGKPTGKNRLGDKDNGEAD